MTESTVKCRICGEPYKVYAYYAGDQSACPPCRARAEANGKGIGPHGPRPISTLRAFLSQWRNR